MGKKGLNAASGPLGSLCPSWSWEQVLSSILRTDEVAVLRGQQGWGWVPGAGVGRSRPSFAFRLLVPQASGGGEVTQDGALGGLRAQPSEAHALTWRPSGGKRAPLTERTAVAVFSSHVSSSVGLPGCDLLVFYGNSSSHKTICK